MRIIKKENATREREKTQHTKAIADDHLCGTHLSTSSSHLLGLPDQALPSHVCVHRLSPPVQLVPPRQRTLPASVLALPRTLALEARARLAASLLSIEHDLDRVLGGRGCSGGQRGGHVVGRVGGQVVRVEKVVAVAGHAGRKVGLAAVLA